jgi:1,4-dihydroxy-2-naphthoate octaprenyltransferase
LNRLRAYLVELRAPFLTVSVLPVVLGTAVARSETGSWDPLLFLVTLAGAVFLHLGSNTMNDWFDHRSGNDDVNLEFASPFTGGSRMIQAGLVTPRGVLILSIVLFALASLVGIYLTTVRGPSIILLGITGLALGILYTAPRAMLAGRGLGEIAIFLAFGLIAVGAFFVQTGGISAEILVAPLPLAILTTAIIVINEFQDAAADGATGKNTLIVRLGRKRGAALYAAVMISAYAPVIAGVASGLMPRPALLGLATMPLALKAIGVAVGTHDDPRAMTPANALTIVTHLATGIILTLVYIFWG